MLTSSQLNSKDKNITMLSTNIDCWPAIEPALNQLLPLPAELSNPIGLNNEDYLKLYTLVFEHCVGTGGDRNNGKGGTEGLICGKDMYEAISQFISHKLVIWCESIKVLILIQFYFISNSSLHLYNFLLALNHFVLLN